MNPHDTIVNNGSTAVFRVFAEGDSLRFQWLRNGNPIKGATKMSYTIHETSMQDDSTFYKVIVRSDFRKDSLISKAALLRVLKPIPPIEIILQPNDLVLSNGTLAVFEVIATGDSLRYQWFKNDIAIHGASSSVYNIPNVNFQDDSTFYKVIIKSDFRKDSLISKTVLLRVIPEKKLSIYHIGNSHSWDFRPNEDFRSLAAAQGLKMENGWHIKCGSTLSDIWAYPNVTCVDPNDFGKFNTALSSRNLDIVTIQTYKGTSAENEKKACINIISLALSNPQNNKTMFYLYNTWPENTSIPLNNFDFSKAWLKTYSDPSKTLIMCRDYYKYLSNSIKGIFPAEKIGVIPVGEVLYQFDQAAKNGLITGYKSAGQLYRDSPHLNNVGRYIASLTVYCVIFDKDPRTIKDFNGFEVGGYTGVPSENDMQMTSELKSTIQGLIYEAIN